MGDDTMAIKCTVTTDLQVKDKNGYSGIQKHVEHDGYWKRGIVMDSHELKKLFPEATNIIPKDKDQNLALSLEGKTWFIAKKDLSENIFNFSLADSLNLVVFFSNNLFIS